MLDAERADYAHEALFFGTSDEMRHAAEPFVEGGLAAGESVALVCTDEHAEMLHEAVGRHPLVTVLSASDVFSDARGAVSRFRQLADEQVARGARRVRVLGEVDFPAPADWREWARFEAISDQELGDLPIWSLCMYDRTRLPPEAVATGRMTHLIFREKDEPVLNPDFVAPAALLGDSDVETQDPLLASPPTLAIADVSHVGPLRHTVRTVLGTMSQMPATVLEDFVLAIHEVVGNGLLHGTRPVSVRLWVSSGRAVCSVTDAGAGFSEQPPDALRNPPKAPPEGPVGLSLVGALVDDMHAYRVPAGFTVTISISYPASTQEAEGPRVGNGF